jgi:hypothetical protein
MSPARKTKKPAKKSAAKAAARKSVAARKPAAAHKPATARPGAKTAGRQAPHPAPHHPAPAPRPKTEATGTRAPAPGALRPEQAKGPAAPTKKPSRKAAGGRREGKSYAPGDLLLPGGCQTTEEIQYFFRGCVAAEHPMPEEGLQEVLLKRALSENEPAAEEMKKVLVGIVERFASGVIEPLLPSRAAARKSFSGFVERARGRRREIGAFLRGLDLGRTEVSHLDSHSETSLQNLMEWTARIEKMVEEGEEPEHADYNQLHRGIDQLDNTTEALIVDLETTLHRQRERAK